MLMIDETGFLHKVKFYGGVLESDETPFILMISSGFFSEGTAESGPLILRLSNVFRRERVPGSDSSGMVANFSRTCFRAGRRIGLLLLRSVHQLPSNA